MSDPTLAEVAEKAVDHIANGVAQIASAVEKIAPGAWDVAVRKQRVEGWTDLAIGVALLVVALWAHRFAWHAFKEDEIDRTVARAVTSVALILAGVLLVGCLIRSGFVQAMNPEFFAAQEIAAMVKR